MALSFFTVMRFWYKERFHKQEFMRIYEKWKDEEIKNLKKKEIIKPKFKIYVRLVFQVLGGIC